MKIKELIKCCENIKPETEVMIYNSPEDRLYATSNWSISRAEYLVASEMSISSFEIQRNMVVVVLA